jgi:hypothetical protein
MTPRILPAPAPFQSSADPLVLLIVWGALALAAVGVAVWLAVRRHDVLPVFACVGALICALNEPIYDVLGNLSYARTPYVAYSIWGRDIPWTLVIGYVPWVGLMPYLLMRAMAARWPRRRLHAIAAGLIVSVFVLEVVNAVWWENWKYYGESPTRSSLGGGVVQMAAMPLLCALIYLVLGERARGAPRALLGLVAPVVALPMVFASTTWPLYLSNHGDLPTAVDWLAAALTIALGFAAVPLITGLAERWQAHSRTISPVVTAHRMSSSRERTDTPPTRSATA